MGHTHLHKLLFAAVLALLLTGCSGALPAPQTAASQGPEEPSVPQATAGTQPVSVPQTQPPTEPEPTQPPTTQPPEPEVFRLSFIGDCTIGSAPIQYNVMYSILWYIGEDYGYPFQNVIDYIDDDDLTVVNLEGTFCDPCPSSGAMFTFRAPVEYVNVLSQNSVEAVSFANNHTMDYRQTGYDSTLAALEGAGIPYVEKDSSMLMTTQSGLTVGFYALSFALDQEDMAAEIAQLREDGAEVVILSVHWGAEGSYRAAHTQTEIAHAAIDAGADIVYGHHPHVLQKIEEYNGGIIYYSLGNFIFGGHHWPQDLDSAILQQEIIRSPEGEISLGELTVIPVSCSSLPAQNDFCPTPYEEGSEKYQRVLDKLAGTYTGPDLVVDYN